MRANVALVFSTQELDGVGGGEWKVFHAQLGSHSIPGLGEPGKESLPSLWSPGAFQQPAQLADTVSEHSWSWLVVYLETPRKKAQMVVRVLLATYCLPQWLPVAPITLLYEQRFWLYKCPFRESWDSVREEIDFVPSLDFSFFTPTVVSRSRFSSHLTLKTILKSW